MTPTIDDLVGMRPAMKECTLRKSGVFLLLTLLGSPASSAAAGFRDVPIRVGQTPTAECSWLNPHDPPVTIGPGDDGLNWKITSTCDPQKDFRLEIRNSPGWCILLPLGCEQNIPHQSTTAHQCSVPPTVVYADYCYKVSVCLGAGTCATDDPEIWVRRDTVAPPEWLAGSWAGQRLGARVEEYWSRPQSGRMTGFRLERRDDGSVYYEFLQLEATRGILTYTVQAAGGAAATFDLIFLSNDESVFANKRSSFGPRARYKLLGDTLQVRVTGAPTNERESEYTFKRVGQ